MSEKELKEAANDTSSKYDDIPETLGNEDPPTSLETVATGETPANKNGFQALLEDKAKIAILLKATGNAPIMKQRKWSVSQDNHIGRISEFVKRYLKLDPNERLFLYVNQTFAPAPDQTVKNLYDCYGADGKLILHYCKSQAWG